MLQMIFGRASTGKTYSIFESIKNSNENLSDIVVLVPEQFTFECERNLLHSLGDKASTDVSILSFTRLCDELNRHIGGRVADVLSEFDKSILMGQALKLSKDNLKVLKKYSGSPKFAEIVLKSVNEFKNASVSPDDLIKTREKLPKNYFNDKLDDFCVLYSFYNTLLKDRFLDPADNLTRLNENLLKFKYFENKTVYIDSFKNFTGQQYNIVERIMAQAKNVYFNFTCDDSVSSSPIFENVIKTKEKILQIAEKNGLKFAQPIVLKEKHYKSEEISFLEELLSGKNEKYSGAVSDISVCKCKTIFDEAQFAARSIRRLVREENYRYRDFVIICRNAEKYQRAVELACKENGVFCFFDKRRSIKQLPLTVFISSAFKLALKFNTDDIMTLHKTRLTDVSREEISEIDNYVFLWNISGDMWFEDWEFNPNGMNHDEIDLEKLKRLNIIRKKMIKPVLFFKNAFCGTPSDLATAVIKLCEKENVAENLKKMSKRLSNEGLFDDAEALRLGYDTVMQILNSIVKCLPDTETTKDEFVKMWNIATNSATIGNIPQMLDEVTFGSADRIKPSRPKIAFVLGMNQGVFPQNTASKGLFAQREREILIENEIEIKDYTLTAAIDEEYLVYTSVCCPTDKLFLTYALSDGGKSLEPSGVIDVVTSGFENLKTIYDYENIYLPETYLSAKREMFAAFNSSPALSKSISEVLDIDVADSLKTIDKTAAKITPENAKALYKTNIMLSATKFDTFHRCRFAYFCKYGLKARRLQSADFDVLQRGTIVHYVLEKIIEKYSKRIAETPLDTLRNDVDFFIDEYLNLISGFAKIKNARTLFLVKKISAALKDVVCHISAEFAQNSFSPEFCELKIGNDGKIPSANIEFDGGSMQINGSIDRVDIFEGFVRIVDYKTGTKEFKLPDILLGLNLQMLIYLYSLIKSGDNGIGELKPAGVLYMPSKRDLDGRGLAMNGLVLTDVKIAEAMEPDNNGEYIPKYSIKDDKINQSGAFISEKLFSDIFLYIELLIKKMGESVLSGDSQAIPNDGIDSDACKYCDYYSVCCIENAPHNAAQRLKNYEVASAIEEAIANG